MWISLLGEIVTVFAGLSYAELAIIKKAAAEYTFVKCLQIDFGFVLDG